VSYTNKFVYDGWNVVAILDGGNNLLYTFTWGTDLSGSMQGAGGVGGLLSITYCATNAGTNAGTYFPCYDGNGNVVALVNAANGSFAGNWEYGPFGELIRATGPMAKLNPFMFSTKFYDWETGLYYYGYRYYNPSTGRWPSRDPIGDPGSTLFDEMPRQITRRIFLKEQREPNGYEFVKNNSVVAVDAFGLQSYMGPGYGAFGPGGVNGNGSSGTSSGCPCGNGGKWMSVADSAFGGDFNKCVDAMWNSTPPQSLPGGIQVIGIGVGIAYPPFGLGAGLGSIIQYVMADLYCQSMHCVGGFGGAGGTW
jgi:RHS repeat-associated protein